MGESPIAVQKEIFEQFTKSTPTKLEAFLRRAAQRRGAVDTPHKFYPPFEHLLIFLYARYFSKDVLRVNVFGQLTAPQKICLGEAIDIIIFSNFLPAHTPTTPRLSLLQLCYDNRFGFRDDPVLLQKMWYVRAHVLLLDSEDALGSGRKWKWYDHHLTLVIYSWVRHNRKYYGCPKESCHCRHMIDLYGLSIHRFKSLYAALEKQCADQLSFIRANEPLWVPVERGKSLSRAVDIMLYEKPTRQSWPPCLVYRAADPDPPEPPSAASTPTTTQTNPAPPPPVRLPYTMTQNYVLSTDVPPTREESVFPSLDTLMEINKLASLSGEVVFDRNKPLAHGGFATVYKGRWGTRSVAVKELKINRNHKKADLEKTMKRRSRREMEIWAALKHPNIVPLYGYTIDEHNPFPAMISEWCEHGNASEYLGDLPGESRPLREKFKLAQEVANGLSYMHSLKLVHGDIKPSNILISAEGIARLCDFGLVRIVECQVTLGLTTTTPYGGTIRYKAPELFGRRRNSDRNQNPSKPQSPTPTFASDVYALGCVIYEFITSNYPYHECHDIAEITEAIRDGEPPAERPTDVQGVEAYMWDILQDSWNSDPERRPAIDNVVERLRIVSEHL